jgi:hypothetical protein
MHSPDDLNVVRTLIFATWKSPVLSLSKTSVAEVYGSCSTLPSNSNSARLHRFSTDHLAIGMYFCPRTSMASNTDSWIYWPSWILRGEEECGLRICRYVGEKDSSRARRILDVSKAHHRVVLSPSVYDRRLIGRTSRHLQNQFIDGFGVIGCHSP